MAKASARRNRRPPERNSARTGSPSPLGLWQRIQPYLLPLIPVLAALVVYRGSFVVPMQFDDEYTIIQNTAVRSTIGIVPATLAAAFDPPASPLSNRPVSALTFVLSFRLGKMDVYGYHVVNLAIYLAAAALLWGFACRTLRAPRLYPRIAPAAPWLATVIATLWVLHPLQTEAVVYITQRTTLLMGLFMLAMFYATARSWTSSHPRAWQAAAIVACACGMGSKEDMVAAPILVVLYDAVFFAPTWRDAFRRHRWLYVGLFATWILLAALVAAGPTNETVGTGALVNITRWEYLMTQARAIVRYLRLSLWPSPLIVAYDWNPTTDLSDVWVHGLFIVGLLAATGVGLVRRRPWGWLGAWFFLILAPTSSVLPIVTELVAERRMYLPLAAVVSLIVVAGYFAWQRLAARVANRNWTTWATAVMVVALAVALGDASQRRIEDYRSELAIWTDTIAKAPKRAISHANLGKAMTDLGDSEGAIEQFAIALEIEPKLSQAHTSLGHAYTQLGRFDLAVEHGRRAVELHPTMTVLWVNLAHSEMRAGNYSDATAAARRALELEPDSAPAQTVNGVLMASQGHFDEAEVFFRRAIQLDPSDPRPYYNLAQVAADRGRRADGSHDTATLEQEVELIRAGLAVRPDDADGHRRLGITLVEMGQWQAAIAEFQLAGKLMPGDATIQQYIRQIQERLRQP